jgi:hypothetical protein
MEYDKNNNSSFWRQYMRLRVKMDVRVPLKKDAKVKDRNGNWCTVRFKYEKLGIFCFVCGVMGHAENRCEIRFAMESDDGIREWSNDLRAEPRRVAGRPASRWLVEERGGRQNGRGGGASQFTNGGGGFTGARQNSGESLMQGPTVVNVQNNTFGNNLIPNHNSQINHIIPHQCSVSQIVTSNKSQLLPNQATFTINPTVPAPSDGASVITPFPRAIGQASTPPIIVFNASVPHQQTSKSTIRRVVLALRKHIQSNH